MIGRLAALSFAGLTLAAAFAAACSGQSVEEAPFPDPTQPAPSAEPTAPMLVDVDPGATMTATPGDGVGVFIEYATGGHWHLWWTCDTNRTSQSCAFDVKVTPSTGAIANATSDQFATTDALDASSTALEATTSTTTTAQGIHFDTTPGVTITLTASVGGLENGAFLFFVQDGQIDGDFTGQLTDPLMLKGSTP
jgi:hypothetical protein